MKRFHVFIAISTILLLTGTTVVANPAPQSEASIITADNIDDLELLGVIRNEDDQVFNDFFIAADGRIATISDDNHAQVWGIDPVRESSGEYVISRNIEAEVCQGTCILTAVALIADHMAVGTLNGLVLTYDIETGDLLHTNREHFGYRVNDITVSSSGDYFVSVDDNGTVGFSIPIFDADDMYFQERIWLSTGNPLYAIAVNPTNQDIAVAGGDPLADEPITSIYTWDNSELGPASIINIDELEGSDYPVQALVYSPDGSLLISGDGYDDGVSSTLRLWDTETGEVISTLAFIPNELFGIKYPEFISFSPDGNLLAVYMGVNRLFVWEMDDLPITGFAWYDQTVHRTFDMGTGEVTFSPDGRFIVANAGEVIQFWGVLADD